MQPVRQMTIFIVILGLISLALTLLIGMFVSQRITAPIIKLTELINKTADLDLKFDSQYEYLQKQRRDRHHRQSDVPDPQRAEGYGGQPHRHFQPSAEQCGNA